MKGTALIIGATGVAGSYLANHLSSSGTWKVYGASRRRPEYVGIDNFEHVAVDLLDVRDTKQALRPLTDVTHFFSCGYVELPGIRESIAANVQLVRNPLGVLEEFAPRLTRVVLVQGTKYYGCHLGPFLTPAKESHPRVENLQFFYYEQEDYVSTAQRGKQWSWSAVRPHSICGFAVGNPMNLITVIGVYASICRALHLPLNYPGTAKAYEKLFQLTDSRLLAQACEWAAIDDTARGEAFNVTNGDLFRWANVWPTIAKLFQIEPGSPGGLSLSEFMADKEGVWQSLVEKHGLRPYSFREIASWPYGDYVFGMDYDVVSDTLKARRSGLRLEVDSEAMLIEMLSDLRKRKIIP